jgi:serine protease Do
MNKILLAVVIVVGALFGPVSAMADGALPDFTKLVKNNHMAVVNISIRQRAKEVADGGMLEGIPGLENSPIDELLKRYQQQEQEQRPRTPFGDNALGSGFIISKDGYIVTNNHVVEGADEVVVRLHDRRQLIAEVIGTDPRSDIALLKIEAKDLPVVSIGNSDELQVGEWVLAIGSPFGFDFSVTAGIVSATGRALPNESYVPFIQTDVAINPGNSGGPLFNLDGDVIGINSQIFSRTGNFMGLSFAIPIEMAMDVSDQLRTQGRVARGWLGVIIQEVTQELAESFGMTSAHGALVARILPDSPASGSTLKVGDVITHFEGTRVELSSSLPPLVGRVSANADASVRVMRNGEPVELTVNIGELPSDEDLRKTVAPVRKQVAPNLLKMEVQPLDDETRKQLNVDRGGVQVSAVETDGPAGSAGIAAGDVILMVDNKSVDSPTEFDSVLAALEDRKSVPVLVQRAQGPVFLALKLDEQ